MNLNKSIETDVELLKALQHQLDICIQDLRGLKEKISGPNISRIESLFNTRENISALSETFALKYHEIVRKCSSFSFVEWLPSVPDYIDVNYVSGSSPWSFIVALKDSSQRNAITSILKRHKRESRLQRLKTPQLGSVVCCCILFGAPFRGVIRSVDGKMLDVLDIDTGKQFSVNINDAFELNPEAAKINAQAIHCALLPEDVEMRRKWTDALGQSFEQNFNRANNLKLMVLHEASLESSIPPKYIVKLKEEGSSDLDEFLGWLEKIIGSGLDIEESCDKLSNGCDEGQDAENMLFTIQGELEILSDDSEPLEVPLYPKCSNPFETERSTYSVPHPNERDLPSKDKGVGASSSGILDVSASEFVPMSPDEKWPQPHPTYTPKEEQKICQCYLHRNYCFKRGCTLKHLKKSDLFRDQVEYTSAKPKNLIDLPAVGERVSVTVTNIVDCHRYYVHLPPIYSDIGEIGALETLSTLMSDINRPATRDKLEALPSGTLPIAGEILLGFGRYKKWARVVISDCDDSCAQVYYPDFGATEVLFHDHLRLMKPEFTHLPYQAVQVTLSGVYSLGMTDEIQNFLQTLLLDKTVDVVIKHSDLFESSVEADVFLEGGQSLGQLLTNKGYCGETRT